MAERKTKIQESEMDKIQKQFEAFENKIKELTQDRMNEAPNQEMEAQTKLSSKQLEKSKDVYLKPERTVRDGQKFNEKFRDEWEKKKEYVQFIAEHKELIGEVIEMWTHPYGGVGAEFWKIPTGKPVWAPRYVPEQIRKCNYHRLRMEESTMRSSDGAGSYFGSMVVDATVPRLTAEPI